MKKQNNRLLGGVYEDMAAEWLRSRGWRILERNFRCRQGEIDLIAAKGEVLAFVEVKYRLGTGHGFSQEAVDHRKQQRIFRVAEYYLMLHPGAEQMLCRFDVAAFSDNDRLFYLEGAFGGM